MTAPLTGPFHVKALQVLQASIDWWVEWGATYVDLPWIVDKVYADATRPAGRRDVNTLHGRFVSSGEQSFLKLWAEDRLPESAERQYIGWTPCMRDEEVIDELHQHGFMKAEWFAPVDHLDVAGQMSRLMELTWRQHLCFQALAGLVQGVSRGRAITTWLEPQAAGMVDLMLGDVEVGSYGIRTFQGRAYIYGTAVALPRFHQALDRVLCSR